MNRKLIVHLLGYLLLFEALFMLPSLFVALLYGDGDAMAFVYTLAALVPVGLLLSRVKPDRNEMEARDGLAVSGLAWMLLSAFGALPFLFSGMTTRYIDAFFECVSGFTTTGATILSQVEGNGRGVLFWRSFTHWIGGMGVLVLTLALMPNLTGRATHLARAESPGPTFSKFTPRLRDTAKVLYKIYIFMTAVQVVLLIWAGLPVYDSFLHAFGTAGTGGFSNRNLSVGAYGLPMVEVIITVFMLLFGVNFAVYFHLLRREFRLARRNEEVVIYFGIALASIALATWQLMPRYGDFFTSLRYASFQVASIMSTTGYCTTDFNLWPQFVRALLVLLMLIGSCAGSTAGGLKVVRVTLLIKSSAREVMHAFRPRKTAVVRMDGKSVSETVVGQLGAFLFLYCALLSVGTLLLSLYGYDLETSFTAPIACLSNIGPGLAVVGPMGSFAPFSPLCKLYLSMLMLAGRLEFFPILALLYPSMWRKR